jgi:hypothetical protein
VCLVRHRFTSLASNTRWSTNSAKLRMNTMEHASSGCFVGHYVAENILAQTLSII